MLIEDKALSYLMKAPLLHMGMIEPIHSKNAKVIYADTDGVMMKEIRSGAYMLSVTHFDKGFELINALPQCTLILIHQEFMLDYISNKFLLNDKLECLQAVYLKKAMLKSNERLEVKPLDIECFDIITAHYHHLPPTEIMELLRTKSIYGGYFNGELIGFIGNHLEGSIGLLEIFPDYRQKGYGAELLSFIVNTMLSKGLVPFGQIEYNNANSIALHKKLGFEVSDDKLYWLMEA